MVDYLKDTKFLNKLDLEKNKFYWVKIEVLDMEEKPVQSIEGRVLPGSSISIDGNSSIRRTCSIIFLADDTENDLTNVDNLLSINKKVKIFTGLNNDIDSRYDDIIWFPQGIYIITQPNISHNASGCRIQLNCKDKMCLLNGECGGSFPISVTFHEYSQIMGERDLGETLDPKGEDLLSTVAEPNSYTIYSYTCNGAKYYKSWTKIKGWSSARKSDIGSIVNVPQLIYDIIQTLVCNYGGESISKIFINDVPLEIKQLVRYTGSKELWYCHDNGIYSLNTDYVERTIQQGASWRPYSFNEDIGYVYTDFIYPGQLISNIGDNVCTILDKIKTALGGNFEYFYDLNGNFIFQEKRNYLNNSYDPTTPYRLDNNGRRNNNQEAVEMEVNNLMITDNTNYKADFNSNHKIAYTFAEENNELVISYNNTPVYSNFKNDFHIWGENGSKLAIHYHLVIKKKPVMPEDGWPERQVYFYIKNDEYTGRLRLATSDDDPADIVTYRPQDWRAELYLRGLEKQKLKQRPDIYEQELLDLFDTIYDFHESKFKADIVYKPNNLTYFFDYLEPEGALINCSVDVVGPRLYSYKQDKMNRLYNVETPNNILISRNLDEVSFEQIDARCIREGQTSSIIDSEIANLISIGTVGYNAQEIAQNLLYQYTNYNESIIIQCLPIYYLDVNTRISVFDKKSGINGDYIIKNITMPIGFGTMNISATKVQREEFKDKSNGEVSSADINITAFDNIYPIRIQSELRRQLTILKSTDSVYINEKTVLFKTIHEEVGIITIDNTIRKPIIINGLSADEVSSLFPELNEAEINEIVNIISIDNSKRTPVTTLKSTDNMTIRF